MTMFTRLLSLARKCKIVMSPNVHFKNSFKKKPLTKVFDNIKKPIGKMSMARFDHHHALWLGFKARSK